MPTRRLELAPEPESVFMRIVWLPFLNVCLANEPLPGAFIQCSARPTLGSDENFQCVMNSYHCPLVTGTFHCVVSLAPDTPRSPPIVIESVPEELAPVPLSRCRKYFSGLKAPSWTDGHATIARQGFEMLEPTVVDGST